MEILSEIFDNIEPLNPSLRRIYEGLPDNTLEVEQERLKTQFAEIGAKLLAINEIRRTE